MTTAQAALQPRDHGVQVVGRLPAGLDALLTEQAVEFLGELERRFRRRRQALLQARGVLQARLDAGESLTFRTETADIRAADWKVRPAPAQLRAPCVTLFGPVDRKTLADALNAGAGCFVADFENAHSPTWKGTLEGHRNLHDAVRGVLTDADPGGPRPGGTAAGPALMLQPRGWHMPEKHVCVDGLPISATLFDFGLYLLQNAQLLRSRGDGAYFYLPKLEDRLEARLWNDVIEHARQALDLDHAAIRCMVSIDTLPGLFQMDEILYELKDYAFGLSSDASGCLFSYIKCRQADADRVLPEQQVIAADQGFLQVWSRRLLETCRRRGAQAWGCARAGDATRADETGLAALCRAALGHDGITLADPTQVGPANQVIAQPPPLADQPAHPPSEQDAASADLSTMPAGRISERALRANVGVALRYIAAWLGGRGTLPIDDQLHNAATAELARAQLWQWVRYPKGRFDDGRDIDAALFEHTLRQELQRVREQVGELRYGVSHFEWAAGLLRDIVLKERFEDFLTLPTYRDLGGSHPCC